MDKIFSLCQSGILHALGSFGEEGLIHRQMTCLYGAHIWHLWQPVARSRISCCIQQWFKDVLYPSGTLSTPYLLADQIHTLSYESIAWFPAHTIVLQALETWQRSSWASTGTPSCGTKPAQCLAFSRSQKAGYDVIMCLRGTILWCLPRYTNTTHYVWTVHICKSKTLPPKGLHAVAFPRAPLALSVCVFWNPHTCTVLFFLASSCELYIRRNFCPTAFIFSIRERSPVWSSTTQNSKYLIAYLEPKTWRRDYISSLLIWFRNTYQIGLSTWQMVSIPVLWMSSQ